MMIMMIVMTYNNNTNIHNNYTHTLLSTYNYHHYTTGIAASMASFLLCSGSRGRRFALPHSRVMIHQPMGGAQGQAEDIRVEASQVSY